MHEYFISRLARGENKNHSVQCFTGSLEINLNTIYYGMLNISKIEDFKSKSLDIFEQSDTIIFIFSIYNEKSLDQLKNYEEECYIFHGQTPIFLIGLDLKPNNETNKTIPYNKIQEMQHKIGAIKYMFCSQENTESARDLMKYILDFSLGGLITCRFNLNENKEVISCKSGGFLYNLFSNGHAELIGANSKKMREIPLKVVNKKTGLTYQVTHIGTSQRFKWRYEEISFPEESRVLHIGKLKLRHLQTFHVPQYLLTLHPLIFAKTRNLTNIVLPRYKNVKYFVFKDRKYFINQDKSLLLVPRNVSGDLYIPQDIKSISPFSVAYIQQPISVQFNIKSKIISFDNYAFTESNITIIDIPKSVRKVGEYCFKNCHNLQIVSCQYDCGLIDFPDNCFNGCKKMAKIFLPNNFKILSRTLINNLPENINFTFLLPNPNFKIIKGTVFSLDMKYLISRNDDASETLVIPSSVTEIYRKSLINSANLTSVFFSKNSKINGVAINIFPPSLVRLVLSPSINTITGGGRFNNLPNLKYVVVTNQNKTIFACSSLDNWNESSKIILLGNSTCEFDSRSIHQTHHRPVVYYNNYRDILSKTGDEVFNHYSKIFKRNEEEEIFEEDLVNREKVTEVVSEDKPRPISEYIIDFNQFKLVKIIGRGSFGSVHLMKREADDLLCAVKSVNNNLDDEGEDFMREVEIMCSAAHPCVAKIIGYQLFVSNYEPAKIAIEYYPNGSLNEVMMKLFMNEEIEGFGDTQMMIIMLGVAMGMRYLHNIDILHRDIKPSNIFLTKKFHPKIGDFGISKFNDIDQTNTRGKFTPQYSAPEQVKDLLYDNKVDVYAYGLILLELVNKKCAYEIESQYRLFQMKIENEHRPVRSNALPHTKQLILDCLSFEANNRPTFDKIVEFIKMNDFKLFGDENVHIVRKYYSKILKSEKKYI